MYEMLTGRAPFTGSLFELITAHREQSPTPISELAPGVDPALEHTIMRMLAKEPGERWGSMADVAQRLGVHTTVQHGDESLRATLSLSGTYREPPDGGARAVDVLTPPGRISTPATPSGPGPLSPVPFAGLHSPVPGQTPEPPPSAGQNRPAAIVVDRPPGGGANTLGDAERPGSRRALAVVSGLLVVAVIAAVAAWGALSDDSTVAPPRATDPSPIATAQPSKADSLVRDSLVRDSLARDSVARVSAARALAARDSARADSATRAARADSIAKAAATAAVAARRDSTTKAGAPRPTPTQSGARIRAQQSRTPAARPESIAVQCARLLERVSLGERLTDAERAILQRRCPR